VRYLRIYITLIFCFNSFCIVDAQTKKDDLGDFNVRLYSELKSSDGNIVISPFSISSALLMAYVGSNNVTKSEFENTLGVTDSYLKVAKKNYEDLNDLDSEVQLVVANSFFADKAYKFKSSYEDDLDKYFKVEPFTVDFKNEPESARKEINSWVEDRTDELIKDLIPSGTLNSLTRSVLVNAIYFNGEWQNKFKKRATLNEDFIKLDGTRISTPFLRSTFETFYYEDYAIQALTLPYEGERFSMIILLPKNTTKEGLTSVEDSFDESLILKIINESKFDEVQISIPKFKAEYQVLLGEKLFKLGLKSAFSEENADFSRMSKEKRLHISEVIHKAFIEVEEEGTKAAAATAVIMVGRSMSSMPEQLKVFKANHPFLYLIRDSKTGLVLFMGRQSEF
jgi:serpin B